MNKRRKNVRYHPPDAHIIQEYAEKVCDRLGIKQTDIVQDFGQFVKLIAGITSRHANEHQSLDNEPK